MEEKNNKTDISKYSNIQIILSIIAILSILFGDFAGWYNGDYYNKIYQEGYIYLGSGILTTAVMLVILSLLAKTIRTLLDIRRDEEMKNTIMLKKIENIIIYNSINLTIVVFSATLFVASVIESDTEEWWLDIAFIAPFVASTAIIILSKKIKNKLTLTQAKNS